MRNTIFFAIATLLIFSACKKSNSFTLKGNISQMPGKGLAILQNYISGNADTIEVNDGKFEYTGLIEEPTLYQLSLSAKQDSFWFQSRTDLFYIENGLTTISGNYQTLYDLDNRNFFSRNRMSINGGKSNDIYENYLSCVRPIIQKAAALGSEILLDTTSLENMTADYKQQLINKQKNLNTLLSQRDSIINEFIVKHPMSQVAYDFAYAILSKKSKMTAIIDESQAHSMVYPSELENHNATSMAVWIRLMEQQRAFSDEKTQHLDSLLKEKSKSLPGTPFKDAPLRNVNGETVSLENLLSKNNYTLIDCWASWCLPCRWYIPHLKTINEEYNNKSLQIISISLDNYDKTSERKQWLQALEDENMPWPQYQTNCKSEFTSLYNVSSIPNIIIISPDKKIIQTGIRGLNVDVVLEEIYNEPKR